MLDEDGFTKFSTLHELQEASCHVYKDNDLFGTYNPSSGVFDYMSYGEYGTLVQKCRVVLRDLGKNPE